MRADRNRSYTHSIAANLAIIAESASVQPTLTYPIHRYGHARAAETSEKPGSEDQKLAFRSTGGQQDLGKPRMAGTMCTEIHTVPTSRALERFSLSDDFGTLKLLPLGILEASSFWRPGSCTSSVVVPTIFSYLKFAVHAHGFTRVNQYSMMYQRLPGKWIRLTVSIETSVESKYYGTNTLGDVSAGKLAKVTHTAVAGIVSPVESYLQRCPGIEQDSHISLFLGQSSDPQGVAMRARVSKFAGTVGTHLQQITTSLYHIGCDWYYDKALDSRPLFPGRPNSLFIAFVRSR